LEPIEELNKELEGYEKAQFEEGPHYVCHGAKIKCDMGTREARLIAKKSHGVYIKKRAQLNKNDCIQDVNIKPMGICKCSSNPNNIHEEEDEPTTKEEQINKMIEDIVELFTETDEERAEDELANSSLCTPQINMSWQNTKETLYIKDAEALLDSSVISCTYGGSIIITFDGQLEE